ncbi:MAG: ATP-binding protein, partial [Nitrospirota bacterium]
GVNAFGMKNLLGVFAPPFAVLNDSSFLRTLHQRDKIAGIAEAVKVSLIRDGNFFDWLEGNAEALSNVQKHAKADRVSIKLEINLEMLRVTISDNGIGFDMDAVLRDPDKWDHFGIRGIIERAKLVGGEGHIDSKQGRGTTITVEVPLMNKETSEHGQD